MGWLPIAIILCFNLGLLQNILIEISCMCNEQLFMSFSLPDVEGSVFMATEGESTTLSTESQVSEDATTEGSKVSLHLWTEHRVEAQEL